MIARIVIALLLVAAGAAGYALYQKYKLRRAGSVAAGDPLLAGLRPGLPTIVYFTSQACAACKYAQGPAISQIQEELGGDVNIVEVDAAADVEAAKRWGIQSVPTTYILSGDGKPVGANFGAADVYRLRAQLKAV